MACFPLEAADQVGEVKLVICHEKPRWGGFGQGELLLSVAVFSMGAGETEVNEVITSFYWGKVPGDRENLPGQPGENPRKELGGCRWFREQFERDGNGWGYINK